MESMGMLQESKLVVGLDFGTTFSGFAYALRADPDKVYTFYDWPMQAEAGGLPYCKTQTSLLYATVSDDSGDPYKLRGWGWSAYVDYKAMNSSVADSTVQRASSSNLSVIQNSIDVLSVSESRMNYAGVGHFLSLFKLHLATKDSAIASSSASAPALPPGMTARRAIVDFLTQISKFILDEVRNKFGSHISLEDVEWCLTVPAIWDERAKKEMRDCSEIAGLLQGPQSKGTGSPHPLKLFIEPEAASIYCQQKLKDHNWSKGDKFLVVDCGGGTVDLVLHEKLGAAPSVAVKEIQESSGAVCGGSRVDEEFFSFLRRKISCFGRFEREYPATALAFRQDWEKIKYAYGGEAGVVYVELPPTLAAMWEEKDAPIATVASYDELRLTNEDMRSIFDPVVNRILQLIEERMVSDLQAILVVGGFSASPYLMGRIRETFGGRVAAIASPPNPGSAVCCGAVTMGIRSDTVVSRISKKTYGIKLAIPFVSGLHPVRSMVEGDWGEIYNGDGFHQYVRKGDEVRFSDCVKNVHTALRATQRSVSVELYSSDSKNVTYITDPGVQLEGKFEMELPSQIISSSGRNMHNPMSMFSNLRRRRSVEVSMFFGRTDIQVTAVGKDFNSEVTQMLPVKFERDSIY